MNDDKAPPFTDDELRRCAERCGHRPSAAVLRLMADWLEELATVNLVEPGEATEPLSGLA
jgi:hypothetical protein